MIEELRKQIAELQEENACWRSMYMDLGYEFGEIVNRQQDTILVLKSENKRLKKENFNLRKTKRRRR